MFKTGDKVTITGRYEFVQYTDGTTTPTPTVEERIVPLEYGETFPPIRSANKGAWWRLI
ncbi:MAG: YjzC family protein [Ardenticatenaceae bacterium]|nr:YjzC family protein [Ardenticatenaceae bacterium]